MFNVCRGRCGDHPSRLRQACSDVSNPQQIIPGECRACAVGKPECGHRASLPESRSFEGGKPQRWQIAQ